MFEFFGDDSGEWNRRALGEADWGPAETRDDEGTILVHGGPTFAKSLTRLGLVDDYQLTTVPIAIGAGGARSRSWQST